MSKLRHALEQLRSSLWFAPTLIVGGAALDAAGITVASATFEIVGLLPLNTVRAPPDSIRHAGRTAS